MNILIADCGATTCNYHVIAENGETTSYVIDGFSPVAQDWSVFPQLSTAIVIEQVYFYGTALIGDFLGQAQNALREQFPLSEIQVFSDLHAAGYSTVGDNAGYVHIMGTGSSTCFMENGKITFPLINMGYIWEDYASGYDIAKTIIELWVNDKLSESDKATLFAELGDPKEFIRDTYSSSSPKLFLAKKSYLLHELQEQTQVNIKNERLELFFTKNIDNFANSRPHHFVGSMAIMMEKEIRSKMHERSLVVGNFIKNTDEGLLQYHRNKITNQ